ncbi:hypothetical protein [Enterococcus canis]|uniref:hypothetical protein n=1 Tax=Enterococcus canis TaxID=214095 RepID=UPI000AFA0845|nr:hypothetical protein [Enterococcus canis]
MIVKQNCYLLWYLPNDIFESSILIFNGFIELENFLKERNYQKHDSDNYRLFLNKDKIPENYISARVKSEELVSAIATIENEEFTDNVPVILIANEKIISVANKELG